MNSQFKHPLGGKRQPAPQNDESLAGGMRPAVPGNQSQGSFAPAGQISPRPGMPPRGMRETPSPAGLTEQATVKQPSFSGPNALNGPLPHTPGGYVQGQHGRYGPGP
ncbi:MAG: hypothetical protein ACRDHW_03690, partial [Ktedonobacteraceae bacterium]